ncbi:hypothetical protein [Halorhabdus tiamatea]|uniref:hypothetical protein n=1 Tax=Halorhabdus tiamatea TaxID=430914 RepID=UPI0011D2B997|nr:hypothetical protein [Halorhabdus tiamatea]
MPSNTQTPAKQWNLMIWPNVFADDSAWEVELTLQNDSFESAFHDVEILLFGKSGEQLISQQVGTVDSEKTVALSTEAFPYLITAKAKESPCNEHVNIGLVYWEGDRSQMGDQFDDPRDVWVFDGRKCDQELPPKEFLPAENDAR